PAGKGLWRWGVVPPGPGGGGGGRGRRMRAGRTRAPGRGRPIRGPGRGGAGAGSTPGSTRRSIEASVQEETMKKRGRILGATLAAALSALASRGHASGETTEAAGIDGTIRVFGCAVEPGDLMVRARPIHVAAAPGTATLVVKAFSAEAPALFAFRFDGLEAGTPYRIGVRFLGATARRCPQFAWSVDREPLVLPGDPSLAFRGFAVRSKL